MYFGDAVAAHLALYLDPNTGSIAFQTAVGALVAASAAIRIYWRRIKSLLRGLTRLRSVVKDVRPT